MANFNLPKFKKNDSQDATADNKTEVKKVELTKKKFLKPKDINFYERYQTIVEGKQKQTDPKLIILPLAGVLVIIFAIWLIFFISTKVTENNNEKIQTYLTENNSSYLESKDLYENTIKTNQKITNLKVIQDELASYPQMNAANIGLIINAANSSGTTITAINYINTTGVMTISGITGKGNANLVKNASAFVKALKNTNLFRDVSYTGYSGDADNGYTFSAACVFK